MFSVLGWSLIQRQQLMTAPTYTSTLTIGELEASYPMYCKALRILVRDGVSESKARRTVCWSRLATLHSSLPRQYRDPRQLFILLRREQGHDPQLSQPSIH